jgi:hypothetical protein
MNVGELIEVECTFTFAGGQEKNKNVNVEWKQVCLGASNVVCSVGEVEPWNALSPVVDFTACPVQTTKKRKRRSLCD